MKMMKEPLIPLIAKSTKRSNTDVRKAIEEGEKLIGSGIKSTAEAKQIISNLGIPPEFLDKCLNNTHMVTPYLSKLGIDEKTLKDGLKTLQTPTNVPNSGGSGRADPRKYSSGHTNGSSTFDKSKYRKV